MSMPTPAAIHPHRRRSFRRRGCAALRALVLALALGWGSGQAQEFLVQSWQTEDGLPDGTVTALAQTADGYLWLGTPKGLARFDGTQFTLFDPARTPGLTDRRISGLLVDGGGQLWVSCVSGTLLRLSHGHYETAYDVSAQAVLAPRTGFAEGDGEGSNRSTRWMWGRVADIAGERGDSIWTVLAAHELLHFSGGRGGLVRPPHDLPASEIQSLCGDRDGRVWLVAGDELFSRQGGRWLTAPGAGRLGGPLARLARAQAGGVWVAAPRGSWVAAGGTVRRFHEGVWSGGLEPTPWTANSLRSQVTTVLEDRSGRIWLGTLWGGLFCSDAAGRWQRVRDEGSFSQCVITCLFEDRQGAIWVGTVGEGLHRVIRRPVTMLTLPPPANENIITTCTAAHDGSVWVGTDGAGAFRYAEEKFARFASDEGLTNHHVCAVLEDRQTNLWAGTWGGLFKLENGRFARVPGPPELGLPVLALFEGRQGQLWIGTPRGVVCGTGGEFSLHPLREGSGSLDIRSLGEDSAGNLWVGTIGSGLYRLREGRAERIGSEQGFTPPNARSIFCDATGGVWVGSDGAGLFGFVQGECKSFTSADGLPSDTISSIVADRAGNLWMGSENGIFACAPDWLAGYARGRSPPWLGQRLGLAEGLANRGCSGSGQPVIGRSADGRLWFPNMRGLAVFHPESISVRSAAPAPAALIESFVVDDVESSWSPNGQSRVPSSARRFEFRYTAPDLTSPQALRFRYRLEGMETDWVEARTRRTAYYSKLPPGDYRFRVMAGGADGQWRESPAPLSFRVVPRLWELRGLQVLFGVTLVAGVIAAVAWGSHRRLERQLERLQMQQALEAERRRIARDLHDDLGARLTEIVLMGELAKRGEASPGAMQRSLAGLTQKVRQLVTAMEEVVWTVNPRNDSLPSLASYLSDYTERFLALAQLSCRLEVDATLPQVSVNAQARHNLLLGLKEALNNITRHAAATQVRLEIHAAAQQLQIIVADDGRGFDPEHPPHAGNGLANLRSRIESLGGRTEIASATGGGTTITFSLPLARIAGTG
jgi:ligand-binding sensor domain-containing protein/signal transduction histidine kinase